MKEQHEFINAGKSRVCCHDHLEGQLFIRRTVSRVAERQYGYVVHPAEWTPKCVCNAGPRLRHRHILQHRKRCYIGRLSYYFTGRRCRDCGKELRHRALGEERCADCKKKVKVPA